MPAAGPQRTVLDCFQAHGSSTDKPLCRSRFLTTSGSQTLTVLGGRVGHPVRDASPRQWSTPLLYQRNFPLPTASLLLSLSTRWKSARFRVGQILNPYLVHYRQAFAFSSILCRQTHWRSLRLAVSAQQRGLPAYHVSYQHRFGWFRFHLFAGGTTSATR